MIDLIDSQPFPDFETASRGVLSLLHARLGFNLWMVTRTDKNDWIVLQSEDRISRKNCDALIGDSDQVPCLKSVLQDERQLLMARLAHVKGSSDAATLATIEQAQQAWEAYKAAACNGLPSEGKRLECEINLTRSRRHDL